MVILPGVYASFLHFSLGNCHPNKLPEDLDYHPLFQNLFLTYFPSLRRNNTRRRTVGVQQRLVLDRSMKLELDEEFQRDEWRRYIHTFSYLDGQKINSRLLQQEDAMAANLYAQSFLKIENYTKTADGEEHWKGKFHL